MESTAPGLLVSNPYLAGILALQLLSLQEIHTENLESDLIHVHGSYTKTRITA